MDLIDLDRLHQDVDRRVQDYGSMTLQEMLLLGIYQEQVYQRLSKPKAGRPRKES